jgi:hypothetical protein
VQEVNKSVVVKVRLVGPDPIFMSDVP